MTRQDDSRKRGLKDGKIRRTYLVDEVKDAEIRKVAALCGLGIGDVVDAAFDLVIEKFRPLLDTHEVPDRERKLAYLQEQVAPKEHD